MPPLPSPIVDTLLNQRLLQKMFCHTVDLNEFRGENESIYEIFISQRSLVIFVLNCLGTPWEVACEHLPQ